MCQPFEASRFADDIVCDTRFGCLIAERTHACTVLCKYFGQSDLFNGNWVNCNPGFCPRVLSPSNTFKKVNIFDNMV